MKLIALTISAALLSACNAQSAENSLQTNAPQPVEANQAAAPESANQAAPLAEPTGPIDPTSVEAAGQVVQHYGALVEQGRWKEAEALWGDPQNARKFASDLKPHIREIHIEIGAPGEMEGAAGSIFVTVPIHFYGKDEKGVAFRKAADVIVRRVNDVPGSTEAQRRWHIDRVEGRDTGAD